MLWLYLGTKPIWLYSGKQHYFCLKIPALVTANLAGSYLMSCYSFIAALTTGDGPTSCHKYPDEWLYTCTNAETTSPSPEKSSRFTLTNAKIPTWTAVTSLVPLFHLLLWKSGNKHAVWIRSDMSCTHVDVVHSLWHACGFTGRLGCVSVTKPEPLTTESSRCVLRSLTLISCISPQWWWKQFSLGVEDYEYPTVCF